MKLGDVRQRSVKWLVDAASPKLLSDVLQAIGEIASGALEEGRVYVDGARERDPRRRLVRGQCVMVTAPRPSAGHIEILAQSGGFVFIDKPPALPTEPDQAGDLSARAQLAEELGISDSRLHAVSRLDVGVSGVVTFARTAEARRRAVALRDHGELSRSYVGISVGAVNHHADAIGSWRTPVDGQAAETRWRVVARSAELGSGASLRPTLLALSPVTGRKHQIRIQAAAAGVPLLGDRLHGGPERIVRPDGRVLEAPRIALHAVRVVLPRSGREPLVVSAPIPEDLRRLWRDLGGDDADWTRAGASG